MNKKTTMASCQDCLHQGECEITKFPFTCKEKALIEIARQFFVAYAEPEKCSWEMAFRIAQFRFGDQFGPVVAIAMLDTLLAMRASRKSMFRYNNPYCEGCSKRLSEFERQLFLTIHFRKSENFSAAAVEAMMLCEGNDINEFFSKIDTLNELLSSIAETAVRTGEARTQMSRSSA